jgi:hypothetical protein
MAWAAIWQDGTEQPLGGFDAYRRAPKMRRSMR